MTAFALSLPARSSLTGEARYGVEGGVCAGVTHVAMGWFGHTSIVAKPRRLDGQDRQHDIGAGVREDRDTR
jgi:hypothetical protein